MKKLFTGLVLALSLGSLAFAEEPKKAPAAPGAPAAATAPAAAPAAPGAPAATAPAAPGAPAAAAPAPAPAAPVKKEIKANKAITLSMFAIIIGITLSVVAWAVAGPATNSISLRRGSVSVSVVIRGCRARRGAWLSGAGDGSNRGRRWARASEPLGRPPPSSKAAMSPARV